MHLDLETNTGYQVQTNKKPRLIIEKPVLFGMETSN